MDEELKRYLNDHLAGAAGAIGLIESLADAQSNAEEEQFYRQLGDRIEADRRVLKMLLEKLGHTESRLHRAAGSLSAQAGKLKLWWEGLTPGELGAFEALEILMLGIQGKRALWSVLGGIASRLPEWEGIDFTQLQNDARVQSDAVESRRKKAGADALLSPRRRAKERPEDRATIRATSGSGSGAGAGAASGTEFDTESGGRGERG